MSTLPSMAISCPAESGARSTAGYLGKGISGDRWSKRGFQTQLQAFAKGGCECVLVSFCHRAA